MKKFIFLIVTTIICIPANRVIAQNTDVYKNELMLYMTASGSMASLDATFDQLLTMMGSGLTDLQKAIIKQRATDRLIELMLPVYRNNISLDDLNAANVFYATPAGKRISAAGPLIIKESTQISMQWATELQTMIQNTGK